MGSIFLLDCECLYNNGVITPKEIALINIQNPLELYYYLIRPSIPFGHLSPADQRRNDYVCRYFHHIPYENGTDSLDDLRAIIPPESLIFV